ncbi:MAG: cellulose biosynthesis (CelD)-like protein, partial [Acidobacteriota bacterium]
MVTAVKLSPIFEIYEVTDPATFIGLKKEWNLLVKSTCRIPLYFHEYIQSLIDSFFSQAKLRILIGRNKSGRLVAALPLVEARGMIWKIPVRELTSIANSYSERFDLIAEDEETAAMLFWDYLKSDHSWQVLRIIEVPQGGKAWWFKEAATAAKFPVGY